MSRRSGFSLVEVVIGMGMASGVVMAICSMHALASIQISSGKRMTAATVLASEIMEDLGRVRGSRDAVIVSCGGPGAASASSDSRQAGSAADVLWGQAARIRLHRGWAVVSLTPLGGAAVPATFASAQGVRASVEVGWDEGGRTRTIRMDQARFHE